MPKMLKSSVTRLLLQDGYSMYHGLSLPGVRRLRDEFEITSALNRGTSVIVKEWTL
jgi:hypothetical protein